MIYFIRSGDFVKIGHCRHDPKARLCKLQIGNPTPLELIGVAPGGPADEREWHGRFDKLRVRGEWFRLEGRLEREIKVHGTDAYQNRVKLIDQIYPPHVKTGEVL